MDGDTFAVILLCLIPAGIVLLLLGGLIADASPRDSSISKFMHGLLDLFEDNRTPPPTFRGKRGGRYTIDQSKKTKRPYRRYY